MWVVYVQIFKFIIHLESNIIHIPSPAYFVLDMCIVFLKIESHMSLLFL